jgi:hypothetical protein
MLVVQHCTQVLTVLFANYYIVATAKRHRTAVDREQRKVQSQRKRFMSEQCIQNAVGSWRCQNGTRATKNKEKHKCYKNPGVG